MSAKVNWLGRQTVEVDPRLGAVKQAIDELNPRSIYHFGCGDGSLLDLFDCEVWGSDTDLGAIERAADKIPHGHFIASDNPAKLRVLLPRRVDVVAIIGPISPATLATISYVARHIVVAENRDISRDMLFGSWRDTAGSGEIAVFERIGA